MADKKLNEVTTVNSGTLANVKNFLAVMNDGSIQQMSKADLASVVGGLLDTDNKVPVNFPSIPENNISGGWLRLTTIKNSDAYGRKCSLMEVVASNYNTTKHIVAFIGIAHSTSPTPFVVSKGGSGTFKLAYKNNGDTSDIYFYYGETYSCVGKIWITKAANISITNDDVTYISQSLPDGASEVSLS